MNIHLPQRICADVHAGLAREWLVTNGVGGFAMGTVAGALTRRYHGLLVAALQPPVGRTLLVAKLDETVQIGRRAYALHTNVWTSGIDPPGGCRYLRRFDLVLGIPTWTFDLDGTRLVKRIWMEAGRNVTYVQYDADGAGRPAQLCARLLVNHRHYHHLAHAGGPRFDVSAVGPQLEFGLSSGEPRVVARCTARPMEWQVEHTWWYRFQLPVEVQRGFDYLEDHLAIAQARAALEPGGAVTFQVGVAGELHDDVDGALARREDLARAGLRAWALQSGVALQSAPVPVAQLVLAADQFVVARPTADAPDGRTLIAGYPWFTDWGRDTMIALPGLTLVTGRPQLAGQILRTWAGHVREGLIPNRFPDRGAEPEYHTADATLWYLWAVDQYVRATGDTQTLAELFPVLAEIIAWHRRGTRHHIRVDDDGLLLAGEPGVNLTWMDAKIGDRVITPRMGKPIELSALWYDALRNLDRLAQLIGQPHEEYAELADTTRAHFERFWNVARRCCYDVIDGPEGDDARLRPNQILAVSLTHSPLPGERQRAVVDACERELHTWFGLRSLESRDLRYRGRYAGGPVARDEAYHQGTAWGWLLGPFVIAHYRVYRDAERARAFLEPLLGQLWTAGVGSLSEVFDGDEPFVADGCPAQAWTVAEALRAWAELRRAPDPGCGEQMGGG